MSAANETGMALVSPLMPVALLVAMGEAAAASNDATVAQLLQLSKGVLTPVLDNDDGVAVAVPSSIGAYSSSLNRVLKGIAEGDQSGCNRATRMMDKLPTPPKESKLTYPNDTLSKILVDNFEVLYKIGHDWEPKTMEFGCKCIRFLVIVIYKLNCWEIYHLLLILPQLEEFITTIGFDVISGLFGPLVKPPELYLEPKMQAGLYYPYPYPFYNFSCHNRDGVTARANKLRRINIEPYPDMTLEIKKQPAPAKATLDDEYNDETYVAPAPRRPGRPRKHPKPQPQPRPVLGAFVAAPPADATAPKRKKRGRKSKAELEQIARDARLAMEKRERIDSEVKRQEAAKAAEDAARKASYIIKHGGEPGEMELVYGHVPCQPPVTVASLDLDTESDLESRSSNSQRVSKCNALENDGPCGKLFLTRFHLLRHQQGAHQLYKHNYKCPVCKDEFQRADFSRHLRREHSIFGKENKAIMEKALHRSNEMVAPDQLPPMQSFPVYPQSLLPQFRNPNLIQRNRIVEIIELPAVDNRRPLVTPKQQPSLLHQLPQQSLPPAQHQHQHQLQHSPQRPPPFLPPRELRPPQFMPMQIQPQYAAPQYVVPQRLGMVMPPPLMPTYMTLPPLHAQYAMTPVVPGMPIPRPPNDKERTN